MAYQANDNAMCFQGGNAMDAYSYIKGMENALECLTELSKLNPTSYAIKHSQVEIERAIQRVKANMGDQGISFTDPMEKV